MHSEIKKTVEGLTAAAIDNSSATTLKEVATSTMPELAISENEEKATVTLKIRENITVIAPPDDLEKEIIKANTFANPIFQSNEINHRSNWNVEERIFTYRHEGETLILSRGYMRDLLKAIQEHNLIPHIIDDRISNPCNYPEKLIGINLRPYQRRAVEAALKFDQGSIVSPTGSGKSLIGLEVIRQRRQRALVIVHRSDLARQWIDVIQERMGIAAGLIGDGSWEIGDEITVAMVQTLASRKDETISLVDAFGLVLGDEIHHLPASTFFDVIGLLPAKYRFGLSATLGRRDGLEEMIYLGVGPTIATITKQECEGLGATVPATVNSIETGFNPGLVDSWAEYLNALSIDAGRNELIIDLATRYGNGPTLILADRIEHATQLSEMLSRREINHTLAHGKLSKKARAEAMENIKTAQLTIGTTSLLGEGLDVAHWSTLVLAAPISSEIKLMQAIGRIVRPGGPGHNKEKALVYDLKDNCAFAGSSFNKRFEIYKKHKIWVKFDG